MGIPIQEVYLSDTYKDKRAPHCSFDFGWVSPLADHLASIARVIAAYSSIDLELVRTAAEFCDANPRTVAAMWSKVNGAATRDEMLIAAVWASKRSLADRELFMDVVRTTMNENRGVRNKFAHGLWGHTSWLPKCILLVEAEDVIAPDAETLSKLKWISETPRDEVHASGISVQFKQYNPDFIRVFTLDDLSDEVLVAGLIMDRIRALQTVFLDSGPEAAEARTMLSSLPALRSRRNPPSDSPRHSLRPQKRRPQKP
jgi:hypothetical protein